MSKQRTLVEWSPHDAALFAVGSDSLRLFETTTLSDPLLHYAASAPPTTQRKRSFRLVKMNAQITQLKCMEWYPFESKPLWIVAGLGSGKVVLSDLEDPRARIVREFHPKYSRPCNAVAWNPAMPSQLAGGFEKVRSDFCTLVWDLNTGSDGSTIMGTVGGPSGAAAAASVGAANGGTAGPNGSPPGSLAGPAGIPGTSAGIELGATPFDRSGVGVPSSSGGMLAGFGAVSGSAMRSSAAFLRGGLPAPSVGPSASDLQDRPVHELSNSEATVALSWVPMQPTCLAVGTGFKWLRIYDLRAASAVATSAAGSSASVGAVASSSSSAFATAASTPLSVVAHNKAVLGVVFDPHRPHILATYTDAPQEVVKVWDIRRLDGAAGPLASLHQTSKTLAQVSWCPTKPGILVTASAEERWISLWDVTKQDAEPAAAAPTAASTGLQLRKPFKRRYTSEPLTSFSWQHVPPVGRGGAPRPNATPGAMHAAAVAGGQSRLAAAAFPNRLLTASLHGEIEDISVHDSLPVALSAQGAVTFSCGRLLFGGTTPSDDANEDPDISSEMQRLAKAGYSTTLSTNLKLLSTTPPTPSSDGRASPRVQLSPSRHAQLRALWQWVDQVEALRRVQASRLARVASAMGTSQNAGVVAASGALRGWPVDPQALATAGVITLLGITSEDGSTGASGSLSTIASVLQTDSALGCAWYDGIGRRLAMLACQWDPDCGASDLQPPRQGGVVLHRSHSGHWSSSSAKGGDDPAMTALRSTADENRHELRTILANCERDGQFARAAALAVFHGDLQTAVAVLQKAAVRLTQLQRRGVATTEPYSTDVLQLVAMAVAGYSSSQQAAPSQQQASQQQQSMWTLLCQQLLRREEITAKHPQHPRYLRALLAFLCALSSAGSSGGNNPTRANAPPQPTRRGSQNRRAWGSVDGLSGLSASSAASSRPPVGGSSGLFAAILNDATLPLSDRLAFACRFLGPDDLRVVVTQCRDECFTAGRLDGLLLSGLSPTDGGVALLQRYVDQTGDVQTAALLAVRLPSTLAAQAPVLNQWITTYQDLLNQWQLFHARARLDVGRCQIDDLLSNFALSTRDPDAKELSQELTTPSQPAIPPQLYVRCNYCNHALSLASLMRLGGSHSSWLTRAKPKLNCCPSCRKPLPQCALCLLPLGALNPYLELAHRRARQTADAVASLMSNANHENAAATPLTSAALDDPTSAVAGKAESETLAQLSSIPFVEWFTWCQSCKHGGHAHHMADWFETHDVCPVTDCACPCESLDLPIAERKRREDETATALARQHDRQLQLEQQRLQQQQQQQQQQQHMMMMMHHHHHQQQQQQRRGPIYPAPPPSNSIGGGRLEHSVGGRRGGDRGAAVAAGPQLGVARGGTIGASGGGVAMGATAGGNGGGLLLRDASSGSLGGGATTPVGSLPLGLPPTAAPPYSSRLSGRGLAGNAAGGSGSSGDLQESMRSMSLSNKLDQLDKDQAATTPYIFI
ncbi:hypothetical protein P43SY_010198 [Pythium insidiosum]|uniref:WD repeat protein mio zinc-ribbon like domain-containing protein n=1 Tax=Pythium insidiosum TaxID=114742 RepID=A0AAD5LRX1_PYTIN|nr:hypothetical protein P43SY_010198 [Pythium insidiosum]